MPRPGERRFATILFTDIVGSTDIASELGDRRWRDLVARHHTIVRRELKTFEGREMDTAGDGFFATFDSPGAAIRCACAISDGVREVGLEIRAGLHGGEVEVDRGKAGGIAVNTAARVMSVGGPGEVLVSSSLHDVVAGSRLGFEDHGVHQLKGIGGEWRLFGVTEVDGAERSRPLDPVEAAKRRYGVEPPPDEPDRRRRLVIVAVGALVAIAALVAFLVLGGEDDVPPAGPADAGASTPPPNSVVRLDARTGEIELVNRQVPSSAQPQFRNEDLAVGEGSVWLQRGANVLKIDPRDGSQVPVGSGASGTGNDGIDVGFGSVWLARGDLWEIDAATGSSEPFIFIPRVVANEVAVGLDHVWVTGSRAVGLLSRFDPASRELEQFEISSTPADLAVGSDSVWVGDEFEGTVLRIEPTTGQITDRIELSGGIDKLAVGEGFVWVLDTALGTLTPIEEAGGETRPPIDVGTDAEDVAVGLGSVWIASGGDLLELDPGTLQVVRTIEVGTARILEVAADPSTGSLWLSLGQRDL